VVSLPLTPTPIGDFVSCAVAGRVRCAGTGSPTLDAAGALEGTLQASQVVITWAAHSTGVATGVVDAAAATPAAAGTGSSTRVKFLRR